MNLKVFWPRHASRTGHVYGWLEDDVAVVVAVLNRPADILDALGNAPSTSRLVQQAGVMPYEIATCNASRHPWLSLQDDQTIVDIVLYDRPERHKLHFLSLEPVSLHRTDIILDQRTAKILLLSNKARSLRLSRAINQMNSADEFAALLSTGTVVTREAVGNRILEWMFSWTQRSLPGVVWTLETRVVPVITRFNTISVTASQIELRAMQIIYASNELQRAQQHQGTNSWNSCGPYVSFWNCIWLLLNDCILGFAVGSILIENNALVGATMTTTVNWIAHKCITDSLSWLDSWPVGLKLNTELSSFFHMSFLAITEIFASSVNLVSPAFPDVVFVFGTIGSCSLSLLIALFTDFFTILTSNITLSYAAAAAILRSQLHVINALFMLFRGTNILRGRVDGWEYDVDQLILGTVLFTLVAFLMPTVIAYYAFFASLRLIILFAYAGIEVLLACLNYFPLFALMLRLKDPARLPGGVYFVTSSTGDLQDVTSLRNLPLPISAVLSHFARYFSTMAGHYHPTRIIWSFVSGRYLDPMPSSTQHLFH